MRKVMSASQLRASHRELGMCSAASTSFLLGAGMASGTSVLRGVMPALLQKGQQHQRNKDAILLLRGLVFTLME